LAERIRTSRFMGVRCGRGEIRLKAARLALRSQPGSGAVDRAVDL
jgi:hypothetical protein